VGDRPGRLGDPAQQVVTVAQVEQPGHLVAVLGEQPVDPPTAHDVQGVADVEQRDVRTPYGRPRRVGDAGEADAAQHGEVPQSPARLLDVPLEQEREFAVGLPALLGERLQGRQQPPRLAPPLADRRLVQVGDQARVAGDQPGVEEAERHLQVVAGELQRLFRGPGRVVQGELGIPDGVPDPGAELVDPGSPVVQEDQVEIAARGALAPPETADGDQRDAIIT